MMTHDDIRCNLEVRRHPSVVFVFSVTCKIINNLQPTIVAKNQGDSNDFQQWPTSKLSTYWVSYTHGMALSARHARLSIDRCKPVTCAIGKIKAVPHP